MTRVKLLFDYIAMILAKQPSDFDNKKSLYIKILDDLTSLEKNHNTILAIQKKIFEADVTEKYLGDDFKNTDNILIYYKEPLIPQQIKCMELQLQNKEATIESKNKLLNVLNVTDLNQRLLQRKSKEEVEQAQTKLYEVHNALHSSLDIYNQLYKTNTINDKKTCQYNNLLKKRKIECISNEILIVVTSNARRLKFNICYKTDELIAHMNSVEVQLEYRVTELKLNIDEFNANITELAKEIYLNIPLNSNKKEYINRKLNHNLTNYESDLLNSYTKQTIFINNYINQIDKLKPSKVLSKNESLYKINWTDFLTTYNLANGIFLLNNQQNCNSINTVNTLFDKLYDTEKTLNSNIKNIVFIINNVQNKRKANMEILKKLNEDLGELKQNNSSMMISYRKNDNLKVECSKNLSDLENKIQMSNTQLTVVTKKKKKLFYDLRRSDMFFKITSQKFIKQINNEYQILLLDDKKLNKEIFLHEMFRTLENTHNGLLQEQNKIMLDQFNVKKSDMERVLEIKSKNIEEKRKILVSYKNKRSIFKQFLTKLNYLETCTETSINGLLKMYYDLLSNNHGKTLKQLEEEEKEYKSNINLCDKKLDELNKQNENIENRSKLIFMNINTQIKNVSETLQQITEANKSLEMELNKKNSIH